MLADSESIYFRIFVFNCEPFLWVDSLPSHRIVSWASLSLCTAFDYVLRFFVLIVGGSGVFVWIVVQRINCFYEAVCIGKFSYDQPRFWNVKFSCFLGECIDLKSNCSGGWTRLIDCKFVRIELSAVLRCVNLSLKLLFEEWLIFVNEGLSIAYGVLGWTLSKLSCEPPCIGVGRMLCDLGEWSLKF